MTTLPQERTPELEDAINQLINLGERDPLTITRRLMDLHGGDWIAEQLAAHWEEIIAEIARQRLGNERRAAITSIGELARHQHGGKQPSKREAVLVSVYIPTKGYISLGDATDQDLAEASAYRRRLADGLFRWADWFDNVRAELKAQNVKRVRDLRGQLPALPKPELGAGA